MHLYHVSPKVGDIQARGGDLNKNPKKKFLNAPGWGRDY